MQTSPESKDCREWKKSSLWVAVAVSLLLGVVFHVPRFALFSDHFNWGDHAPLAEHLEALCRWDCHILEVKSAHQYLEPADAAFLPAWAGLVGFTYEHVLGNALQVGPPLEAFMVRFSTFFSILGVMLVIGLGTSISALSGAEENQLTVRGRPIPLKPTGLLLGLALALFPYAVVYSCGYSEALFMVFYAAFLWALLQEQLGLAAVFALGAGLTRNPGIWLWGSFLAPLAYQVLRGERKLDRKVWLAAGIVLAGAGAFLLWEKYQYGMYFAFIDAQKYWPPRKFSFLGGLRSNLPRYDQVHFFLYASMYAGYRFMKRGPLFWKVLGLETILMAELPLYAGGFWSYERFMACNLGVLILLIEVSRNRLWLQILLLVLALIQLNLQIHNWLYAKEFLF